MGLVELLDALTGAAGAVASAAEFSKDTGEEDPGTIPPLRFAGSWPRSSMYWATLSQARRKRSLPASDCRNTGSMRWRHASLWRAASFDLRRITSHPGQPVVRPGPVKSDLRSCVWRGALKAGSSLKTGGSKGAGSTSTGARIPMRASPGLRLLGCSSEADVSRIARLHLSEGGRRRTDRHLTRPVGVRINDSALPSARPT